MSKNFGKTTCKYCGKEFEKANNRHFFCSDRCKRKYNYSKTEPDTKKILLECCLCGKSFLSGRKKKYCSVECRSKTRHFKRNRKTAKQKPVSVLSIIAEKARLEGLSYGKYVAKYGL